MFQKLTNAIGYIVCYNKLMMEVDSSNNILTFIISQLNFNMELYQSITTTVSARNEYGIGPASIPVTVEIVGM